MLLHAETKPKLNKIPTESGLIGNDFIESDLSEIRCFSINKFSFLRNSSPIIGAKISKM